MALDLASRMIFLHKGKIALDCPAPNGLTDSTFLHSIGLEPPLSLGKQSGLDG
jgi:hypothetical protein